MGIINSIRETKWQGATRRDPMTFVGLPCAMNKGQLGDIRRQSIYKDGREACSDIDDGLDRIVVCIGLSYRFW